MRLALELQEKYVKESQNAQQRFSGKPQAQQYDNSYNPSGGNRAQPQNYGMQNRIEQPRNQYQQPQNQYQQPQSNYSEPKDVKKKKKFSQKMKGIIKASFL